MLKLPSTNNPISALKRDSAEAIRCYSSLKLAHSSVLPICLNLVLPAGGARLARRGCPPSSVDIVTAFPVGVESVKLGALAPTAGVWARTGLGRILPRIMHRWRRGILSGLDSGGARRPSGLYRTKGRKRTQRGTPPVECQSDKPVRKKLQRPAFI